MDNSAAVYDFLSNVEAWDTYDSHKLVFHRDGTGEVRGQYVVFIDIVCRCFQVLSMFSQG